MAVSKKLNILFVTHEIPDPDYSDVLPIYYLIKHLGKKGHKIYLFSMYSRGNSKRILDNLSNYCDKIRIVPSPKGKIERINPSILTYFIDFLRPNYILRHLKYNYPITTLDMYYSQSVEQELKKFLNEIPHVDLIHSSREMIIYLVNLDGAKIVQPYDCITEWYRRTMREVKSIFLKFAYFVGLLLTRIYETKIYSEFDSILVVTHQDRLSLLHINPSLHVEVLPNGIDIRHFCPSTETTKEETYSLVFVSKMNAIVSITNVLWFYHKIFKKLKQEFPVRLYLVGRDPAEEIQKLDKDPSVKVTGEVPDIRPYISKSSIVIVPTIVGTGIKNKTLQGLAMKKPVISTSIGVNGILGQHKKHFLVCDSPKDFIEAIKYLISNPKDRKKLGHRGRKLIENKYSWDQIANKYLTIVSKIIQT